MLFERWRAPVYRLLIPFATGIILYEIFLVSRAASLAILIGSILLTFRLGRGNSTWIWKWQLLVGSALFLSITSAGILFSSLRDLRQDPTWIGNKQTNKSHWLVEVREEAKPTRTGWRITGDLLAFQDSISLNSASGGVYIYTKQDFDTRSIQPGDRFWIYAVFKPIQNKPNSSFDYARYCRQQKITHQSYFSKNTILHPLPHSKNDISFSLHQLRTAVLHRIYQAFADSTTAGLATALLIGWKGGLESELKQHYTRTGTIHIIAISGLHVSLVFEILWLLLYPLVFIRGGAILRQILALSCIWTFCFIAGGEASVLRAGIMFTAISLGRWMERPVSGMQALGLSMLALLIADPDWLFDPGFQLSHAAVAAILLIHPILTKCLQPKNPLVKNTWESACMTLAATIGTLPFTAYYFHQFPVLFLPANLIAVPLSSLALLGLFFLIPFASIPLFSVPIAWAISGVLNAMNGWVEQLDRIPGAVFSW